VGIGNAAESHKLSSAVEILCRIVTLCRTCIVLQSKNPGWSSKEKKNTPRNSKPNKLPQLDSFSLPPHTAVIHEERKKKKELEIMHLP